MSETPTKALAPIATNANGAIVPADHGEMFRFATAAAKSTLVPAAFRGKPDDIFIAMQQGAELGFTPMQALNSIAVINGKATLYAEAMGALVMQSGLCEEHTVWMSGEGKARTAHIKTKRKGMNTVQETRFSMQDAETAGLTRNPTYKSYPDLMLMARAKANNYRLQFPDVCKGVAAREEMQDTPRTASATSRMTTTAQATDASAPSPALRRKVVESDPDPVVEVPAAPPAEAIADDIPPSSDHDAF